MNQRFDRLSRYPYEDEKSRQLIDANLNDEEIEYIIEYSIAPYEFIEYVESPIFNVYHINFYNRFSDLLYYLNPLEIVDFVEEVIRLDKVEEAAALTSEYSFSDILFWLNNGDVYQPGSILVDNPNDIDVMLDENHTVSCRSPYQLSDLDFIECDEFTKIRTEMYEPLKIMCADMDYYLGTSHCGNLRVDRAFVPYTILEEEYDSESEDLCLRDFPGHSEHQLGLAIDISAPFAKDFHRTYAYRWLKQNAENYGFIFSYADVDPCRDNHLRYVGLEKSMKDKEVNLNNEEGTE